MKIKDITNCLESIAPLSLQESYDNAGLIVGDPQQEVTGVVVCLDSIEAVIDEAIAKKCNLVVAHHPIVFNGLKQLNGKNYVERVVLKAIKNDIAIYAIHTNLDNVFWQGVNSKIAEKLQLHTTKILAPKKGLLNKLVVFCPFKKVEAVKKALFAAGAGNIGDYDECSFSTPGKGTFRGDESTNPYVGEKGQQHSEEEERIEVIYPSYKEKGILRAMVEAHPYEEVAYDCYQLKNSWQDVGSGLVGELVKPMDEKEFLSFLKTQMKTDCIRYTALRDKPIQKVALCGGAGSFLLQAAKGAGADVFITGDFKYHEFFDADGQLIVADIGHYESEQYTIELIAGLIKDKFANFAVHLTGIYTNPIKYL